MTDDRQDSISGPLSDPNPGAPTDPTAVSPTDPATEPIAGPVADPIADPTPPRRPRSNGPVQYRGSDLEPDRGPGLGCFRFQLVVLAIFIVLAPLSVGWGWPQAVSAGLLFAVILLLLVTGQTIIFLLRLVAADRRGRRRPLASETRTVGELEDAATAGPEGPLAPSEIAPSTTDAAIAPSVTVDESSEPEGPVRQ